MKNEEINALVIKYRTSSGKDRDCAFNEITKILKTSIQVFVVKNKLIELNINDVLIFLMEALENFDPTRSTLSTYFNWYANKEISNIKRMYHRKKQIRYVLTNDYSEFPLETAKELNQLDKMVINDAIDACRASLNPDDQIVFDNLLSGENSTETERLLYRLKAISDPSKKYALYQKEYQRKNKERIMAKRKESQLKKALNL